MNFIDLPDDILYSIFLFFDINAIPYTLCKKWYNSLQNELWWKGRYESTLFFQRKIPMIHSWKWICQIQCKPVKKPTCGFHYEQPGVFPFFAIKEQEDFYAIRYKQGPTLISETQYHDGDKYIGVVEKNFLVRDEYGIYFWNTLGDMYIGGWNIGHCHGDGIYYWGHGCIYSGQWKKQRFHGKGIHIFSDGAIFEGRFENHRRMYGKMIWRDGSVYYGEWGNDSSGQGKDWDGFLLKNCFEQIEISKKMRK